MSRSTWWLALQDWKRNWAILLLEVLVAFLVAGVSAGLLAALDEEELVSREILVNSALADLIFFLFLPSLGFPSREYLSISSSNGPLTKRLILLRSFPISLNELVGSRVLVNLLSTFVFTFFFFFCLWWYLLLEEVVVGGEDFLSFVLIWLGIVFFINGLYLFLEMSLSDHRLYRFYMGLIFFIAVVVGGLHGFRDTGVVFWSIQVSQLDKGVLGALFTVCGMAAYAGWVYLARTCLRWRDLNL